MNWYEMIKFNEEHLKEFVDNKDFWKRFNELEVLFEVLDDDLRGYERIKYITLNEFMLKSVLNEVREKIQKIGEIYIQVYDNDDLHKTDIQVKEFEEYIEVSKLLDKVGDK